MMARRNFFVVWFVISLVLFHQTEGCGTILTAMTGRIHSTNYPSSYPNYDNCTWRIKGPNPSSRINLFFPVIKMEKPRDGSNSCYDYIRVTSVNEADELKGYHGFFCGIYSDRSLTSSTNILKIYFYSDSSIVNQGFEANYTITNYFTTTTTSTTTTTRIPCTRNEIACPNGLCIMPDQICDGVNDCLDYSDENCWRAPWNKTGVEQPLENGTLFLYKNFRGSKDKDVSRILTTFQLTSKNMDVFSPNGAYPISFADYKLDAEISSAFLRNDASLTQGTGLALNVLALKAVCKDPQDFYGLNLTASLTSVELDDPNPLVAVALCVADVDLTPDQLEELEQICQNQSPHHAFAIDMKAMSFLGLKCAKNRGQVVTGVNLTEIALSLASLQDDSGSFGSIVTSALVGQALLSLKSDHTKDWDFFKLVNFLKSHQNNDDGGYGIPDIATTSLVLPVLAGRSLLDLTDTGCPVRPRIRRTPEVGADPMLKVTYSLWLENDKHATYTLHYKIPAHLNATFFDLFKMASDDNPKYKATWKMFPWGPTVYSVNNIFNMPQDQVYWRLFRLNNGKILQRIHQRLDQVYLKDGVHYVFWHTSTIQ